MDSLFGRRLLKTELPEADCMAAAQQFSTMTDKGNDIQCNRCGTLHEKQLVQLPNGHYFCPTCIQMGRVCSQDVFYHLPEPAKRSRVVSFTWTGTLTAGQRTISQALQQLVVKKQSAMIWAVTGAGKTEILFATLHQMLQEGARIGIASPRVDVCFELLPRIQAVFPKEKMAFLHGKMDVPYEYTQFVLCTTHQLLRFYRAFDLLIIDEVDAFPYVHDPMLHFGAKQALKENGSRVYLTATPTKEMQQLAKKEALQTLILPARYHRRPLPVPRVRWCRKWMITEKNNLLPQAILQKITDLLSKNSVLIFGPTRAFIVQLAPIIQRAFPEIPVTFVHAKDPLRHEKVAAMRKQQYRIFLTSTILERGVTFDNVSVLVIGANHPVFSSASLVQITGRVDRKMTATQGEVWFIHDGQTKAMTQAVKQIRQMNDLAKKRGLIE